MLTVRKYRVKYRNTFCHTPTPPPPVYMPWLEEYRQGQILDHLSVVPASPVRPSHWCRPEPDCGSILGDQLEKNLSSTEQLQKIRHGLGYHYFMAFF